MARIAMLVGDGYQDAEFQVPYDRLLQAGHQVTILGRRAGEILHGKRRQSEIRVELAAGEAAPEAYDALVIPGGLGPDKLRRDPGSVAFTRHFHDSRKPLAAICHGPLLLIEAEVARGHALTSWPSIRADLVNAGARWLDQAVVTDGNLITSRRPGDLDAFCAALLEQL